MQEAKDPKSKETATGGTGSAPESKDSDATSSETLSDMEENEEVSDTSDNDRPSSSPSPDGAFDEQRGGSDIERDEG